MYHAGNVNWKPQEALFEMPFTQARLEFDWDDQLGDVALNSGPVTVTNNSTEPGDFVTRTNVAAL